MKSLYLFIACICSLLPMAGSAQTFSSVDIYTGADSSNPYNFIEYNNKMYFVANDGVHGYELWVSDGTQGGSHLVSDIWPGVGSSSPAYMIVFNNKLYFSANDSAHGAELWVTDGTSAGTNMVADIYAGANGSYPSNFMTFNGKLYFSAIDSLHGNELWSTDGTTGGTAMVADIWAGPSNGDPGTWSGFYEFNGKLYFCAADSLHGYELWVTDGTTGGTTLLVDINPGPANSYAGYTFAAAQTYGPPGFQTLNNKMFFSAEDSAHGYELWVTDGTTAGTTIVDDIWPGTGGSDPGLYSNFILLNNKIYFGASDSTHGNELWVTDGTTGGTTLVADIFPGPGNSYPEDPVLFNNKIYFDAGLNSSNYQLFATDGTTSGTVALTNIFTTGTLGFDAYSFVVVNNALYFYGVDSLLGYQLYSISTANQLQLLQPPIAPNADPLYVRPIITRFGSSLVFAASYTSIGNELWFYTPAPTAIGHLEALDGIQVYPNPFTSQISLTGLQNGTEYHLTLTDIQGRTIEQYELTGTGATNTLHLPGTLASGMYLLQLSNGDRSGVTGQTGAAETVKIVKE